MKVVFLLNKEGLKLGYSLGAIFQIHLHSIPEMIKSYFGVGKIFVEKNGSIQYKVSSIKDLRVIIDHFVRGIL